MEKVIEIDLNNKYNLVDKYNEKKVSNEMIEHIIKEAAFVKKNEEIKIVINKKCYIHRNSIKLIKEGLIEEYNKSLEETHRNNIKQIIFLFLGVTFIFLSTLIEEGIIWKEVLLISGWVPIWEMIEVALFPDVNGRKKRKIIRNLLTSEIIEKTIETRDNIIVM